MKKKSYYYKPRARTLEGFPRTSEVLRGHPPLYEAFYEGFQETTIHHLYPEDFSRRVVQIHDMYGYPIPFAGIPVLSKVGNYKGRRLPMKRFSMFQPDSEKPSKGVISQFKSKVKFELYKRQDGLCGTCGQSLHFNIKKDGSLSDGKRKLKSDVLKTCSLEIDATKEKVLGVLTHPDSRCRGLWGTPVVEKEHISHAQKFPRGTFVQSLIVRQKYCFDRSLPFRPLFRKHSLGKDTLYEVKPDQGSCHTFYGNHYTPVLCTTGDYRKMWLKTNPKKRGFLGPPQDYTSEAVRATAPDLWHSYVRVANTGWSLGVIPSSWFLRYQVPPGVLSLDVLLDKMAAKDLAEEDEKHYLFDSLWDCLEGEIHLKNPAKRYHSGKNVYEWLSGGVAILLYYRMCLDHLEGHMTPADFEKRVLFHQRGAE